MTLVRTAKALGSGNQCYLNKFNISDSGQPSFPATAGSLSTFGVFNAVEFELQHKCVRTNKLSKAEPIGYVYLDKLDF